MNITYVQYKPKKELCQGNARQSYARRKKERAERQFDILFTEKSFARAKNEHPVGHCTTKKVKKYGNIIDFILFL